MVVTVGGAALGGAIAGVYGAVIGAILAAGCGWYITFRKTKSA
jgi:ABC-type lipoprotein release transport system permease subunit